MNLVKGGREVSLITASLAFLSSTSLYAKDSKPVIVVHRGTSGLGLIREEFAKREMVMKESLEASQKALEAGGNSTDAMIIVTEVMEDSSELDVGEGTVFTADSYNELDVSLMDGKTLNTGAIAMAKTIKNSIEAAKVAMEKAPHTLIAGEGADKSTKANDLGVVGQRYFHTEHRYRQLEEVQKSKEVLLDNDKAKAHLGLSIEPYLGAVGAIALDKDGNLAAGASTGGMISRMTGRMGDSPIIGTGNYANSNSVVVSCMETGDIYIRVTATHEVVALYRRKKLSIQRAAEETVKEIAGLSGTGGVISIDKNDRVGYAWTRDKLGMYHGEARVGEEPKTFWPVAE